MEKQQIIDQSFTAWKIEPRHQQASRDQVLRYQRRWLSSMCQSASLRLLPPPLRNSLAKLILANRAQSKINKKAEAREAGKLYLKS